MVITGARQIGKSFIVRKTASKRFQNYVEVNMQDDFDGDNNFKDVRTTRDFYLQLSALYGDKLNNANDTIVFIDEIQVYPLVETSSKNLIKLYYNDVEILSNILYKSNINAILNSNCGVNLGSVYETACAMELRAHGHDLYYFDSKKIGEVDFLTNDYDSLSVLPIEVKSGNDQYNFRAIPKLVKEPYNLNRGCILGNENVIRDKDKLTIYPIYMIMFI